MALQVLMPASANLALMLLACGRSSTGAAACPVGRYRYGPACETPSRCITLTAEDAFARDAKAMRSHSACGRRPAHRHCMFPPPQTHVLKRCNSTYREALCLVSSTLQYVLVLSLRYSMLNSMDSVHPTGHALSAAAGNDTLFLKHNNAPVLEGFSLNQTIQLLVTVQEALDTFCACRSQYGDDWLLAQGLACGLDMDDVFIANYEHLLLRLQAELVQLLTRKALEELLRGGHDKRQRKLLAALFSEFAEKPRPLSMSFPWSIKPSLAVLWGVCWMFYDRHASEHDGAADEGRVRQARLLQHLDFPSVPWSAPASSDCKFL
jgi:hypothetical protein